MGWTVIRTDAFNPLEESQVQGNAVEITKYFLNLGWTKEAIAGALGNLEVESYLNPAQYEADGDYDPSLGYGLAQWTPVSKYQNWAVEHGYKVDQPLGQLEWLRIMPAGEWFDRTGSSQYYLPYSEFQKSTADPTFLARVWDDSFERSARYDTTKSEKATYWYKYISGISYRKKFPIYFYLKHR